MHNMSLVKEEIKLSSENFLENSVMIDDKVRDRILASLTEFFKAFLTDIGLSPTRNLYKYIKEFIRLYPLNPAKEGKGATPYNTLLWLFMISRVLQPKIIIESGVYIGRSLWILRQSVPDARLIAFDVNLKHLKFGDKTIEFNEMDWSECDLTAESPTDFCYFDDHINNCLRIRQAYERGFQHLVFDDSPSASNLYHFRYPGVPIAQMLLDNHLGDGDIVKWIWNGKLLSYKHNELSTYGVRDLIKQMAVLPTIKKFTGFSGPKHVVYVQLVVKK